ncbi:hypothetical protein VCHC56A2_1885, partial [Vibrio cholerae HC-56A2]
MVFYVHREGAEETADFYRIGIVQIALCA